MPKTFSNALAIFWLVQMTSAGIFFAEAGPLSKTKSESASIATTGKTKEDEVKEHSRMEEELVKRLSPEGLKTWQAINLSGKNFYTSPQKSANTSSFQREIEGQLKHLSDDDVRTILDVTAKSANIITPSPEMVAFYEAAKQISPEGRRLLLAAVLLARLNNEELADTMTRQLSDADRQMLMQAVMEVLEKSGRLPPEQKALMAAAMKMSPKGKRLMFSMIFLKVYNKNDELAKAKFDQLSDGDLQILKNEVMAVQTPTR